MVNVPDQETFDRLCQEVTLLKKKIESIENTPPPAPMPADVKAAVGIIAAWIQGL